MLLSPPPGSSLAEERRKWVWTRKDRGKRGGRNATAALMLVCLSDCGVESVHRTRRKWHKDEAGLEVFPTL